MVHLCTLVLIVSFSQFARWCICENSGLNKNFKMELEREKLISFIFGSCRHDEIHEYVLTKVFKA